MDKGFKKVSLVKGAERYDNVRKALDFISPDLCEIRGKRRYLL